MRIIALWQYRDLSDDLIPLPKRLSAALLEKFARRYHRRVFVCLGAAKNTTSDDDADNCLRGTIVCFVFPFACLETSENYRKFKEFANNLRDWHNLSQECLSRSHELETQRADELSEFTTYLKNNAYWSIDFELQRTGLVTFENLTRSDSFATQAALERAQKAFFFLRDIVHSHYHHAPRADTLLRVSIRNSERPNEWAIRSLRSLYRKTIEMRRQNDLAKVVSAKGILAYARTLQKLCDEKLQFSWKLGFEEILQSIVSKEDEIKAENTKRAHRRNVFVGTAFTLLALCVGMGSVFSGYNYEFKKTFGPVHALWEFSFSCVMQAPVLSWASLVIIVYFLFLIVDGRLGGMGPYPYLIRVLASFSRRQIMFISLSGALISATGTFLILTKLIAFNHQVSEACPINFLPVF